MNLTILGAGSFGTAMANHAAQLGHGVRLWCRNAAQAEAINATRVNPRYLKGCRIDETVRADSDFEKSVAFSRHIILAVPTQSLRDVLERLAALGSRDEKLLSLAKGIEIATGKLPHQVAEEVYLSRTAAS
ncbi:MAG: NAD(P)-binding domain-containing protein, partial [Synergistaceae bacterium]|nr:NAD(P)-binding domain-containing protein [Synergistaceae bacterium]